MHTLGHISLASQEAMTSDHFYYPSLVCFGVIAVALACFSLEVARGLLLKRRKRTRAWRDSSLPLSKTARDRGGWMRLRRPFRH